MAVRPGERLTPELQEDPLASTLANLVPHGSAKVLKLDALFSGRPQVLESVKAARLRGVSSRTIAEALSRDPNSESVSTAAVERWSRANGIKVPL